ncbi:MAG TPA: PaaX family transcriptional regulator C-terminal domain-containing protein [Micromonosporaceae bacterium]|nr:PaaX family transcriptional regulator C-terminal domain-containing protein [Micromonosporaceae bacterium]
MQARSALFDLYGDHLRAHGGRAPVAALVRLLAPLEIGAPAVRTAVSRMVRQGWLLPLRLSSGPGYLITQRAAHRLDEAAERIYRTNPKPWEGTFDLIIADAPVPRADRQRIANNLAYLGYGTIGDTTWVATKPSPEAEGVLSEAGVRFQRFSANHSGGVRGATALVSQAWDLERIGREYRDFVVAMRSVVERVDADGDVKAAYMARFRLVHAWRTFLFRDPALPPDLLPARWPGHDAAEFFDLHASRLRPAADEFVAQCLSAVKGGQP